MDYHSNYKSNGWRFLCIHAVIASMLIIGCSSSNKKGITIPKGTLFLVNEPATAELEDSVWVPERDADIRGRVVEINPILFTQSDTLTQGTNLLFNLFEEEHFNAVITRSTVNSAGILSVSGRLSGLEGSWFTMSLDSNRLLANISLEGQKRHYAVYYSGEMNHHVVVVRDPTLEEALQEHPPVKVPDTLDHP